MRATIVVDLGFGDAGKGMTVDYLASESPEETLVVRFSGGHQVGHTVVRDNRRHTFSNYGAGTLLGVPTYYLPSTTMFLPSMQVEQAHLGTIQPDVYVHPLTKITTPYDLMYNRATEHVNKHGSCGVGFGATVERNQNGVTLTAQDLTNKWVTSQKLKAVNTYYQTKTQGTKFESSYSSELSKIEDTTFIEICGEVLKNLHIATPNNLPKRRTNYLFEGSQGVLLDQTHGIFPHVTRSHTTSKNALEFLKSIGWNDAINIVYVSRCYQTRHGNGPMSSTRPVKLVSNEQEANQHNTYQGHFRTSELDVELLQHAMNIDEIYHAGFDVRKHLMITCLDQRPDFEPRSITSSIGHSFSSVMLSHGPEASTVTLQS